MSAVRVCAALCLVVGLTACAGSDADSNGSAASDWTADDWPVIGADWAWGPGTELGEDLVVPDDTYAIGPVMAVGFKKTEPGTWVVESQRVSMASTADPYDLALDFAEQSVDPPRYHPIEPASVTGETDPPKYVPQENLDKLCDQIGPKSQYTGGPEDTAWGSSPYTVSFEPWARLVECWASAWGVDGDVDLRQDLEPDNRPVVVAVSGNSFPTPTSLPEPPDGVKGPSAVPSGVEGYPDLQIVDGSFLAGPPGWGSVTGGFTAVIGVTGDPDAVFDAYVHQDSEEAEGSLDTTIHGMRVRQHTSAQAGGVWLSITMNEMDGNAWIYVSAQND